MYENISTEFKQEYNTKVNSTMLAFLNTHGGTLYIGISDDGSVYGVKGDIDLELRKIASSFRDSVTPDPTGYFRIESELRDGKHVIRIDVDPGSAIPYCFSKHGLVPRGVYVRVGSNTVMATREHIRQMIKENSADQFIAELSMEQNLTFDYAGSIFAEKEVAFELQQKRSLGLIRSDGRYTNLALILSDQCPYTTKVAIFEGSNKEKFKDRKEFTGSLFKQIDDTLGYLNVFNRVRGTFEGAYRVDYPDYPAIAFREAYINALIHRDYYIDGSVLVSMFDDRVEFMSLGGAMPGVTHDLMLTGVSVARNEKLAQIFYRLNIIEAFGTGIPRIYSAYDNSSAQPEIPIIDGGFLIRLPNMNYHPSESGSDLKTGDPRIDKVLSTFQGVDFLKEDVAETLGISPNGAYKLLRKMKEQDLLTAKKSGKKWLYATKQD